MQRLAVDNPIATTLVFNHTVENARAHLIGRSKQRKTNDPLHARDRGIWGVCSSNHDVKETNDRASLHIHGQAHGGATPALVADLASDPELCDLMMKAIDTQVSGELPLEYHAAGLAQERLRVAKRRDAAYCLPELPSEEEFNTKAKYAGDRARFVEYKAFLDRVWWPEFKHHAFVVVMNRHTHEHMKSCCKGNHGKIGCRFGAPWPHNRQKTQCLELRPSWQTGELPVSEHDVRCPVCFADGALSDRALNESERELALENEARRRDLFFTTHDPSSPDGSGVDSRILSVEIRRRLFPIAEEGAPSSQLEEGVGRERLQAAVRDIEARHGSRAAAGAMEVDEPVEPVLAPEELEQLVAESTRQRAPWSKLRRDTGLEGRQLFAKARATMCRLVGPTQKLGRLLDRTDFAALRHRIEQLAAEPSTEVEESAGEDFERKERRRMDELIGVLDDWTWKGVDAVKRPCVMACRNAIIADFTMVLAGCVKSNAVPLHLGAGTGSKAAAMYQIKYMGKDSVEISASANVLIEAHRHVHDPLTASTAEDTGEAERNAKHFAQHVVNCANMELELNQAAGIVLGIHSSGGSDNIEYLGVWDLDKVAVAASKFELDVDLSHAPDANVDANSEDERSDSEGNKGSDTDEDEDSDPDENAGSEDDACGTGIDDLTPDTRTSENLNVCMQCEHGCDHGSNHRCKHGCDHDEASLEWNGDEHSICESDHPGEQADGGDNEPQFDLLQHFHLDGGDCEGSSGVYYNAKGNPVVLSAAHHYAYRDAVLSRFNAHEFHRAFQLRKMDSRQYPKDRIWYSVNTRLMPLLIGAGLVLRQIARELKRDDVTPDNQSFEWEFEGGDPGPYPSEDEFLRRLANLMRRFPSHSKAEIGQALKARGGHGGHAAHDLELQGSDNRGCTVHPRRLELNRGDVLPAKRAFLNQLRTRLQELISGGDVAEGPAILPLTQQNAKGRHVLVPRERWPDYSCDEHDGAGWEAKIVNVSTAWGFVDFTRATDDNGLPYKKEWIKLDELQPLAEQKRGSRAGRPCERYVLRWPHSLHDSHILVRRAKWGIPALAGKPPPREPDLTKPDTRARRAAASAFARYFCALFTPWSQWSPPGQTHRDWKLYVDQLEETACLYGPREDDEDEDARNERLIAAARLFDIENVKVGFDSPKAASIVLMKQRQRYRSFWTDATRPPLGQSEVNGVQRDAAQEIQKLREKAERLRGKKDIATRLNEANAAKAAADLLRKQLPSHREANSTAAGSRLRELWKAASEPECRTAHGVARDVREINKANAKPRVASNVTPLCDAAPSASPLPPPWPYTGSVNVLPPSSPFADISAQDYDHAFAAWKASEDAGHPVASPLNPEQRNGGRDFLLMARLRASMLQQKASAESIAHTVMSQGLTPVTLVVGAGGTGKSAMVHELRQQMHALGCGHLLVTAYTGVAAAPFKGPTLLSLFNLGIESRKARRIEMLSAGRRETVRKKFFKECGVEIDNIGGIVIDEVSFNELEIFGHIDGRLRQLTGNKDVVCGGIPLLLIGDNHQKAPTTGNPWYKDMVKSAEDHGALLAGGPATAKSRGLELLQAARRVQLRRNMRAMFDPAFVKVQEQMRDTDLEWPVSTAFVRGLRKVSTADLASDEEWRFAPVGVLQHAERDVINVAQAKAFARTFGLPLIRWRLEMVDEIDDVSLRDDLYADEDHLWGYFVEGAPVNLTENISSTRGLVNGSAGILDSLSFENGLIPSEVELAYARAVTCRGTDLVTVDLLEAPLSVNVQVGGKQSPRGHKPGSAPGAVCWHGVELDDLSDLIESVTPNAQVISLLLSNNVKKEGVALRGLVAAQNSVAEKVLVKNHAYRLAFALTDHKLQGRTLSKLILNIFKRTVPPWMNLASFYVLISRCRTSDSLRLLQHDSDGLAAVRALKHDEYLAAWEGGYADGRWSDELCMVALKRVRRARQQAREARDAAKKAKAANLTEQKRKQAAAGRLTGKQGSSAVAAAGSSASAPSMPVAAPHRAKAPSTSEGKRKCAPISRGSPSKAARVKPYSSGEMEAKVEDALSLIFSEACDECSLDELLQMLGRDPRAAAAGRDVAMDALDAMEAKNKVMYREGRIHLI